MDFMIYVVCQLFKTCDFVGTFKILNNNSLSIRTLYF